MKLRTYQVLIACLISLRKYSSHCVARLSFTLPITFVCRTQLLIMQELVNTEMDYIRSLEYVVDNYIPEMNCTTLPQPLRGKKNVVFANIEKIYEFHSETLQRLLQQCMNCPFQLGSCILQHVRLVIFLFLCIFIIYFMCILLFPLSSFCLLFGRI